MTSYYNLYLYIYTLLSADKTYQKLVQEFKRKMYLTTLIFLVLKYTIKTQMCYLNTRNNRFYVLKTDFVLTRIYSALFETF